MSLIYMHDFPNLDSKVHDTFKRILICIFLRVELNSHKLSEFLSSQSFTLIVLCAFHA